MAKPVIWLWQRIVSPHMAGLAVALAREGREVVYVAEELMSAVRTDQGWSVPALGGVGLEIASSDIAVRELVSKAAPESIHICQGVRANGLVGSAQLALAERGLRQWVVMEMVNDTGWRGLLKRLEYRRLFLIWRNRIEGVLATGHLTPAWVAARGVPEEKVYPFAYFLSDETQSELASTRRAGNRFRFIFVGQFIERKRLDFLIDALASLRGQSFELTVIGSGRLEAQLRNRAETLLPGKIDWIGRLPLEQVQAQMATADCLILPSRHDGWGAVVPEALSVGTPVICSDSCGSAGVVLASGVGGVFPRGKVNKLTQLLERALQVGKQPEAQREQLKHWAESLSSLAGAAYLGAILDYNTRSVSRPQAPWLVDKF